MGGRDEGGGGGGASGRPDLAPAEAEAGALATPPALVPSSPEVAAASSISREAGDAGPDSDAAGGGGGGGGGEEDSEWEPTARLRRPLEGGAEAGGGEASSSHPMPEVPAARCWSAQSVPGAGGAGRVGIPSTSSSSSSTARAATRRPHTTGGGGPSPSPSPPPLPGLTGSLSPEAEAELSDLIRHLKAQQQPPWQHRERPWSSLGTAKRVPPARETPALAALRLASEERLQGLERLCAALHARAAAASERSSRVRVSLEREAASLRAKLERSEGQLREERRAAAAEAQALRGELSAQTAAYSSGFAAAKAEWVAAAASSRQQAALATEARVAACEAEASRRVAEAEKAAAAVAEALAHERAVASALRVQLHESVGLAASCSRDTFSAFLQRRAGMVETEGSTRHFDGSPCDGAPLLLAADLKRQLDAERAARASDAEGMRTQLGYALARLQAEKVRGGARWASVLFDDCPWPASFSGSLSTRRCLLRSFPPHCVSPTQPLAPTGHPHTHTHTHTQDREMASITSRVESILEKKEASVALLQAQLEEAGRGAEAVAGGAAVGLEAALLLGLGRGVASAGIGIGIGIGSAGGSAGGSASASSSPRRRAAPPRAASASAHGAGSHSPASTSASPYSNYGYRAVVGGPARPEGRPGMPRISSAR